MPVAHSILPIALLVASVVGGCADAPVGPRAIAGPSAIAARDGLVVALALEHAPFVAGEPVQANITVTNTAIQARHYEGGGCNFLASVTIETAAVPKPDPGRSWDGLAGRFKSIATGGDGPGPAGQFLDESVAHGQPVFCPADLGANEIKPGERLEMHALWSGEVLQVVAPAGPARVIASFPYLGLPDGGEMVGRRPQPIEAVIAVDVVDRGLRLLSPGLAADAALADPAFAAWVASTPMAAWQGVSIEQKGHAFDVILTIDQAGTAVDGVATVDRTSGAVTFTKRNR